MKTPRELLLERHRTIEKKLNRIRAQVVASKMQAAAETDPQRRHRLAEALAMVWQEVILPSHRWWAGLAAVWLVILAIHLTGKGTVPPAGQSGVGPGVLQAFAEERRVLAELLQSSPPSPAEQPRPTPRPRTQGPAEGKAC